jgi:hypothetical protein
VALFAQNLITAALVTDLGLLVVGIAVYLVSTKSNAGKGIHIYARCDYRSRKSRGCSTLHHGGAGTTAAGLRAGVPSIVIPFFGDQPFWGQRVAELGVGPEPIPRKKLTVERLAQAIHEALTDQTMRQRAANLGSKIQAEDGITRAVALVQQIEERRAADR